MIIKICGLTSPQQALACAQLGADWLGLNCWPGSKRYIPLETVRGITSALPEHVVTVGVFVNASHTEIEETVQQGGLHWAQLHGDETPEFAQALKVPWFRAFRVGPQFQEADLAAYGHEPVLLDAWHPGEYGGTGLQTDLAVAQRCAAATQVLLAGGLNPENVGTAIEAVRPWGVDVASGVESAPGVKDLVKVQAFIDEARAAGARAQG